jgi:hypothetical protein
MDSQIAEPRRDHMAHLMSNSVELQPPLPKVQTPKLPSISKNKGVKLEDEETEAV